MSSRYYSEEFFDKTQSTHEELSDCDDGPRLKQRSSSAGPSQSTPHWRPRTEESGYTNSVPDEVRLRALNLHQVEANNELIELHAPRPISFRKHSISETNIYKPTHNGTESEITGVYDKKNVAKTSTLSATAPSFEVSPSYYSMVPQVPVVAPINHPTMIPYGLPMGYYDQGMSNAPAVQPQFHRQQNAPIYIRPTPNGSTFEYMPVQERGFPSHIFNEFKGFARPPRPNPAHDLSQISNFSKDLQGLALGPSSDLHLQTSTPQKLRVRDPSSKHIIITANGILSNISEIAHGSLQIVSPSQFAVKKSVGVEALNWLGTMSPKDRFAYMQNCYVEIFIPMISLEDEEAEMKKNEVELKREHSTQGSNEKELSLNFQKDLPAIIKMIKSLPDFLFKETQKLTVILDFPDLLNPPIPTGPRAATRLPSPSLFTRGFSTHTIALSPSSYTSTPNFRLCAFVAYHVNDFSSLSQFDIILAPPPNMRTPMTLPQLNCFLPFYDLEYRSWEARWQTGFMSKSEIINGWPLGYLNQERDKILIARMARMRDDDAAIYNRFRASHGHD